MTKRTAVDELIGAVYRSELEKIDSMIGAGTDVNGTDPDGRTALIHAILADSPSIDVIKRLIALGTDLDFADKMRGWTALHFAAQDQSVEIACALIKGGATVDFQDGNGNTPLWRALMTPSPSLSLLKMFLEAGANPDTANNSGVSSLLLAERMAPTQPESKAILALLKQYSGKSKD